MKIIEMQNPEKWNETVFALDNFHYLQTKEWGDFKNQYGWRPLRYVIEENGEVIGAMHFLKKRTPLGKNILYCPKGPLIKKSHANKKIFWEELKKNLGKIGLEHNAFLVKIEPQIETKDIDEGLIDKKVFIPARPVQLTNCTIINDLELKEEEVLKRMRKNARYNIRLAQKNNILITENNSRDGLENFLKLYYAVGKRTGVFLRNKRYIASLLKFFINKGRAKIFLAEQDDNFLAGAVIFIIPPRAWYAYGGSVRENKNAMPSYLLQFEIIKKLKNLGVRQYDLGGVPCLNDGGAQKFMSGLYTFKSHFGGDYKEFFGTFDVPLKKTYYEIWNKTEYLLNKYYKIFKKDLFY